MAHQAPLRRDGRRSAATLMSVPPPSAPAHLLRTHTAAVNALHISDDNERLYSADASGSVVITSTRSFRPLAQWQAHTDSILGVQEWEHQIITETDTQLGESATTAGTATPTLKYSMDVNALNYCRFSLLPLPITTEPTALIALPNLIESSLADVWELPSQKRLHAAIGKTDSPLRSDGRGDRDAMGIIMSMHLFQHPHPHASGQTQLRLLCCYENGGVTLWAYTNQNKPTSIEGIGWERLWTTKAHNETGQRFFDTLTIASHADFLKLWR
ncbi:hypothetical protein EIP86_002703 [Pleurotus ostreatoroseus]|nr:hypothetical protein EIP86_002703 [Pleurotus ostreatoroseus]